MTSFNYDRPPLGHWGNLAGALFCLAVIALIAFGCEHPDKHYDPAQGGFVSSSSDAAAPTPTTTQPVAAPGGATAAASDPLPPGKVAWFGTPKCGSAARVARAEIANLRVSPPGLSYKWVSGGCEALGASGAGDIGPICALGYQTAAGAWKIAKFDHISTSRTSRDYKNLQEGYNGWNWGEVSTAKSFCFVILSADGKRRTNYAFVNGSVK